MRILIFLCVALLLFSFGCDQEACQGPLPGPNAIKIIPLGDSRVEGAPDDFESYRYELWKKLVSNKWEVDFIGSRYDDHKYAKVDEKCFDGDHEGTGGATTTSLLATLEGLKLKETPEVALLGIGGNDLADAGSPVELVLENLEKIVRNLQNRNDSMVIFLEQIAPGTEAFMTPALTSAFLDYNASLPAFANRLTTPTSKIILINMAEGWSDSLLADPVHYNEEGARLVANRYYQAIEENIEQ